MPPCAACILLPLQQSIACRYRAFAMGQVPVHWVVHFDPRGQHTYRYRCKNVNLVEKTVKGVEDELEFLFVPCGSIPPQPLLPLNHNNSIVGLHSPPAPASNSRFAHVLCRYSVFSVISVTVPAKITGSRSAHSAKHVCTHSMMVLHQATALSSFT